MLHLQYIATSEEPLVLTYLQVSKRALLICSGWWAMPCIFTHL